MFNAFFGVLLSIHIDRHCVHLLWRVWDCRSQDGATPVEVNRLCRVKYIRFSFCDRAEMDQTQIWWNHPEACLFVFPFPIWRPPSLGFKTPLALSVCLRERSSAGLGSMLRKVWSLWRPSGIPRCMPSFFLMKQHSERKRIQTAPTQPSLLKQAAELSTLKPLITTFNQSSRLSAVNRLLMASYVLFYTWGRKHRLLCSFQHGGKSLHLFQQSKHASCVLA